MKKPPRPVRPRTSTGRDASPPVEADTPLQADPGRKKAAFGKGSPDAADVPIVGIGASAGGLSSFEAFFSAMPADAEPGMAFVLVQHLSPDHKSLLADLVRRYTTMQVFEVEDGMPVQPRCAYIIPPNRDMAVLNGTLTLLARPETPRPRLPIDFFFRSLAEDRQDRAIGIVLAGTGSDGTLGARAIKGHGGMVMAQTPESTEFDGMPRSVIAAGLVDYVLRPEDMPAQVIAFASRRFAAGSVLDPTGQTADGALKRILVLLRAQTGHDFSLHKQSTVLRRIGRRMAVHQLDSLDDYVRYLQDQPAEGDALFGDLLIGVTNFFRDRDAFAALEGQVIPQLFEAKPAGATIRVWTAGCSTGEEAYSIAILLQERIQALKRNFKLQYFATDIDRRAIDIARAGIYPSNIAADVSAERLARFFVHEPASDTYRVHKTLRDMLVFSEHDVTRDPPFSRLDLISCRNLLIYMGPDLQRRLIPLFHYALNPSGVLFLGTSETVAEFVDLFSALDRKAKLYQRKADALARLSPPLAGFIPPAPRTRLARSAAPFRRDTTAWMRDLTEQALLKQGQVGALVDESGDILYLHGRSGHYLEPAPGEAAMNVLKMAREGLRRELTTALHQAVARRDTVAVPGVHVKTNGSYSRVNLTVRLAVAGQDAVAGPRLFVVIFEEAPLADLHPVPVSTTPTDSAVSGGVAQVSGETDPDPRIATLTRELRAKEEHLQTVIEELETANEELKSSNEEMQSINEELQSANEELETSKEEMQSVNEELVTVNAELQTKVSDLSRANNDMNNLLAGTGMGTVFVDHQLRIQRFTPAITQAINLIPTDVGRPVAHIVSNLVGYHSFIADIQAVLETLTPKDVEVQSASGSWFLLRIRPYRTLENVIEGAVITFTDISDMKAAQMALREAEGLRRLAVVVRDAHDPILVQSLDGRITAWNPAATRAYGWSETEALTMNIRALSPDDQRESSIAATRAVAHGDTLAPYRTSRLTKGGGIVEAWIAAAVLVDDHGQPYAIATTERIVKEARP